MARYINWADVANKYKDAGSAIGGSEEVKSSYINGAEDEVDACAAAAGRYTIPFTPTTAVPGMIKDLIVDLAYFKMTVRQRKPGEDGLKTYIDERMKAIREGTLILVTSGTAYGVSDRAWSSEQGQGSVFGRDDPTLWDVNCVILDASADNRDR